MRPGIMVGQRGTEHQWHAAREGQYFSYHVLSLSLTLPGNRLAGSIFQWDLGRKYPGPLKRQWLAEPDWISQGKRHV